MATLLLTRPDPDNDPLAAALREEGVELVIAPVMVPALMAGALPEPGAWPEPGGVAGVIVTSRRALDGAETRRAARGFASLPCFVVGPGTAEAARAAGFIDIRMGAGTGADLARLITAGQASTPLTGPLLYLAARERSPDLEAGLARAGIAVIVREVYAMDPTPALPAAVTDRLAAGEIGLAAFYSRRSAEAFCALTAGPRFDTMRAALVCLCLSRACTEPLQAAGFARLAIADHPDGPGMERLVHRHVRDHGARGET